MRAYTRHMLALAGALVATSGVFSTVDAAELRGSLTSMTRQHAQAVEERYSFLRTPAQVREFASEGRLERLTGDANFRLANVSYPYARPEVRQFLSRLAAEYRAATGEMLVVTSLTRPIALQPANAHRLSVHPAGMAVDLRVPASAASRAWLESALLALESRGVLDVTRERRPPHYHVAVFPDEYRSYAAALPPVAAPPKAVPQAPAAAASSVAVEVTAEATAAASSAQATTLAGVLAIMVLSGLVGRRAVRELGVELEHQRRMAA